MHRRKGKTEITAHIFHASRFYFIFIGNFYIQDPAVKKSDKKQYYGKK